MSKEDTLDDILDDEKVETPEEPPVEEPDQDDPEIIAKEEPEPEPEPDPPAVEPKSEKETGLQAALTESRANARALQEQVTAMQTQLATVMQQQAQPVVQQPKQEVPQLPDPLQDPEAYNAAITNMMSQREAAMRADFSERSAKQIHGADFVEEAYRAAQAQGIVDRFRASADPWGDLANWHKDQKDLGAVREAGGIDALREQIRQEIAAESAAQQVADDIVPAAAPSLAGSPNLGQRRAAQPPVNDSLKDILGNAHDI